MRKTVESIVNHYYSGIMRDFEKVAKSEGLNSKLKKYIELYQRYLDYAIYGKEYPTENLFDTYKRYSKYIVKLYKKEYKLLLFIRRTGRPVDLFDVMLTEKKAIKVLDVLQTFISIAKYPKFYSRLDIAINFDNVMSYIHSGFAELASAFVGEKSKTYAVAQDIATAVLETLSGKKRPPISRQGTLCVGTITSTGFIPNVEMTKSIDVVKKQISKGNIESFALAPGYGPPPWWNKQKWGPMPRWVAK